MSRSSQAAAMEGRTTDKYYVSTRSVYLQTNERYGPPSTRRRPKWLKIPEGLINLWRLSHHEGNNVWRVDGIFKGEEAAYAKADEIWAVNRSRSCPIRVEHKAGIEINGKLYVVNVIPVVCADEFPLTMPPNLMDHHD